MEYEKIRMIRKSKRMTLEELAQKTGLSLSYLSQVERGKADCSISVIRKIATALGVHPVNFFDQSENEEMIVRKDERRIFGRKNKGVIYELLTPDTHRKMQVTLVEFPPHYKDETVTLRHDKEEWIYVLTGKIVIKIGENEHALEEGDSIYFTGVSGYSMENRTGEKVSVIGAITPPIL